MTVTGIGGFFFRARHPEKLSQWYRDHLGIGPGCAANGAGEPLEWAWRTLGGPVVFAPFAQDSDYFAADRQWMLNLRVTALDPLIERLRASGIEVVTKDEWDVPETGRFARIHDPEGNAVELWEMPGQGQA